MSPALLLAAGVLAVLAFVYGPRLAAGLSGGLSGRAAAGAALLGAALLLFLLRQPALAAPVALLALPLLRGAIAQGRGARPVPGAGGRSEVGTAMLRMWLDRDSGEMGGEVLAGRFAGRALAELSAAELQTLAAELEVDPDSLGLLLAYLERRGDAAAPGGGAGGGAGNAGAAEAPPGREMSETEALRILGLAQGASRADVRAAHRRLMMRVHPDLGGSDALAALINAAKARLDP